MISENTSSCLRYEIEMSSIPAECRRSKYTAADTRRSSGRDGNEQQPQKPSAHHCLFYLCLEVEGEQSTYLTPESPGVY